MDAGRMDRRLGLYEPVKVKDELTGAVEDGYSLVKTVWARRVPSSVAERVIGRALVSAEEVVWSIRYRSDVNAMWKVKEGQDLYKVIGVMEGWWRKHELLIHASIERPMRG